MLIDPERLSYALYKLIPDETEMIEKEESGNHNEICKK